MIDLELYRSQVEELCRRLRVRRLDLIGSAVRADFTPASDVDVLVDFDGDGGLFDRYFILKERLEAIFGRPVDVIEERALRNPYLIKTVERDRRTIYGA